MNLLIDTQALLWFESGDSRLPEKAKQMISDSVNLKFISLVSFWEIAIKHSLGKLELHVPFDELLTLSGYIHLHVSEEHLKVLLNLNYHHRDPFDRLLVARLLHENLSVVSSDSAFDLYGLKRIW